MGDSDNVKTCLDVNDHARTRLSCRKLSRSHSRRSRQSEDMGRISLVGGYKFRPKGIDVLAAELAEHIVFVHAMTGGIVQLGHKLAVEIGRASCRERR